jgi:hypothetical protein
MSSNPTVRSEVPVYRPQLVADTKLSAAAGKTLKADDVTKSLCNVLRIFYLVTIISFM